jgi:uncharacterized protein DUF2188/hemerythrin HHE cation binding domain-containing protein
LIPPGDQQDAVSFLKDEHANIDRLFVEYEELGARASSKRRRSLVERMIVELRVHAAMEEQSFYPSVREVLAEGDVLVNEGLEEHAQAKEDLAELEATAKGHPSFGSKVARLISDVRHHVNEEEGGILPKLAQAVGAAWLVELGQELRRTKERLSSKEAADGSLEAEPDPAVLTPQGPPSMRMPARKKSTAKSSGAAGRSPAAKSPRAASKSARASRSRTSPPAGARSGHSGRVTYHVTPTPAGRWQVLKKGAARASSTHDTKAEAVARGKELARKQRLGQLVVHTADGKIQHEFTYRADPQRSLG